MKAVVIKNDKTLSYEEVEELTLKDGEVKIEVYAASINRADLLQREGSYPPPSGWPTWPGLEVAGVIKEITPSCKRFKVGDEVCALLGGGGYAEYVNVPENMVMVKPKNISFEEASAIPEVYATAYLNLFYVGNAKQGETLLVTGGNSGLASAIIPVAKTFGLRTIVTVRGEKKVQDVAYLHADLAIDTKVDDLSEILKREEQNGHPVDIAIDCLGGEMLGKCLKYVARGCRWIQIATLAGDISPVDFRNIYVKNIHIIGSTLRSKSVEEKKFILSKLEKDIFPKIESGDIKIKIHKVLPIEQVDEAQQMLYRSEVIGKVVLKVK